MEPINERQQCSVRHTFYKDDNFQIEYQEFGDTLILHCEVLIWKPSVLKEIYKQFARLQEDSCRAGYKRMATLTPNPKFAKLFGGETRTVLPNKVEFIVWDLTHLQLPLLQH